MNVTMRGLSLAGLAILFVLALAGSAGATSYGWLDLKYSYCGPTEAAYTIVNGVRTGAWYAGQYNLKTNSLHSTGDWGETLWNQAQAHGGLIGTYCIDIGQNAPPSFVRYDLYDLADAPIGQEMGATKANDLRRLYSFWSSGFGDREAGAFEVAVWEIINETAGTPYNVASGYFRIQEYTLHGAGGWSSIATGWLDKINNNDPSAIPNPDVVALVNAATQDYALTLKDFGSEPPIPEPVTMAGLVLGIGCLAGYIRRRKA
ncbi:MAG: PEP-CTERM sorting domain-containing protein [Planctomycetota bacterium]|nr:PEP-CTERM sorting domain-containing protein [Planctomycetota bacterium]